MSVHVLYDHFKQKSVMFCSTDGIAFGPVFDGEEAVDFTDWMIEQGKDPRDLHISDLLIAIEDWEEDLVSEEK